MSNNYTQSISELLFNSFKIFASAWKAARFSIANGKRGSHSLDSSYEQDLFHIFERRIDGLLHDEGGPALKKIHIASGISVQEAYFLNGKGHRIGGPCIIERDLKSGRTTKEVYAEDDVLHRDDGPASTTIDPKTGIVTEEIWFSHGRFHRVDGPAFVRRDSQTGLITKAQWNLNGQLVATSGIDMAPRSDEQVSETSAEMVKHGTLPGKATRPEGWAKSPDNWNYNPI